jgi:hypothetical protein
LGVWANWRAGLGGCDIANTGDPRLYTLI